MSPILSIIIPCYNSEATLDATLNSVINQKSEDWEALIINDGSKDKTEEIALKWTSKDIRFKYYSKENEGLGKTRNFAINIAKGTYILPLDSDNLVEQHFVSNALKVFNENLFVGVVHGYAEYFGEKVGLWKIDEFNFQKILIHNYIDACAIYKKELWLAVGGYDENMPFQGHEDWEFWIALANRDTIFYNLHEITFKYFVSKNSMIRSFSKEMVDMNQDYIVKKYSSIYHKEYCKAVLLNDNNEKTDKNLKSKKFVLILFCKTFLGFCIPKKKHKIFRLSFFKWVLLGFKNKK